MAKKDDFTYDMTFTDAINKNRDTLKVLKKFNLKCNSCSGKAQDNLKTGAINHGIDPAELLKELNKL
ncbi:disulfide oxidoreductase [Thermodesulfobacteriota bacterium]